ncbi:MAG: HRDC domain-containing protein [Chromatiales bacterium]|jgi:ribonuclease D|nr:HRDC domain-containing protein [Chromatiales bacterium]
MPALIQTGVLVDQQAQLDDACAAISRDSLIAVDTEFARTTQFTPRLCLVQIAAGSQVFCVDELAGLDTSPLWDILCSGTGLRVVHAAKQDLEVAWATYQRLPQPLFDTQIAAALIGHPAQVGYAALVKALLDVDVDKTHTRADWSQRPLRPELIAYANTDVIHLPTVHALLGEELDRLGRHAWAMEDSARLVDPGLYRNDPDNAWRRLSGLPRMPVAVQLRARRLARWREEQAIRADRPRQWIISDRALLDIAQRNPRDESALANCEDLPAGVVRRQAGVLLAELAAAAEELASGTDLQQELRSEQIDQAEIRRLGKIVDEVAKMLGVVPEILATRKDLTALIRGERDVRPLSGWRKAVIGEPLLAAVNRG